MLEQIALQVRGCCSKTQKYGCGSSKYSDCRSFYAENGVFAFQSEDEKEKNNERKRKEDDWCFERYNCPRFTTPDEKGNVILDYGISIEH